MKISNIVLLKFLVLFILSCEPAEDKLVIINNSDENIYLHYSCNNTFNDLNLFKSGYYQNKTNIDSVYVENDLFIKSGTTKRIIERGFNAWNGYLKDCEENKIYLFFFSESVVETYSNDEIKNKRMYEKKFVLTLKELKEKDLKITYP